MEKSEFDDYFAVLGKASDQTRSVLYVFIIVYIAMLLYGLNAFVYPTGQFIYNQLNLHARCLYHPEGAKCETPEIKSFLAGSKLPPPPEENLERSLWSHQLEHFYDNSAALRTFKFPILGWETDMEFHWLIFPLIGMISYYILGLAFSRTIEMFRFLLNRNRTDAVRLRLIQSTVVITTPLGGEHSEHMLIYRATWQVLALFVLAIPIIISLLTISDLTNAIPAIRDGATFLDRWTAASLTKLAAELTFQVITVAVQLALFGGLVKLGLRFGRYQKETRHLIAALEAQDPGS